MLDVLFTFPIVMIDGDKEDKKAEDKHRYGVTNAEDVGYDMVLGYAEYPYYDFIGMEDRWLPNEESLDNAMKGDFDSCIVRFNNVGQLLVPWSRKKFKAELKKFTSGLEISFKKIEKNMKIITLTPEQFKKNILDE